MTFVLERLRAGKHRLTVAYAGTSIIAPARSKVLLLTVRR